MAVTSFFPIHSASRHGATDYRQSPGRLHQANPQSQTGHQSLHRRTYGVFTEKSSLHNKYLFLAGGIGITPIRSLFEQTTADNKDAILLYANKSLGNAILKEELENLNQKKHSKIIHVISDDASYRGEKGHIDQEKLNRLVPDIEIRDIYLCGPSPMIKTILAILEKMGIPKQQIHYEIFSL